MNIQRSEADEVVAFDGLDRADRPGCVFWRGKRHPDQRRDALLRRRDAVALLEAVLSLRQRKWERCKRGKCEQDECASDDLRFNGGVLFFHGVVLRVLGEFSEAIRCVYKCAYIVGNMLVAKNTKGRQDFFTFFFEKLARPESRGALPSVCAKAARRSPENPETRLSFPWWERTFS